MSLVADANQVSTNAGGRRPQWDKVAAPTTAPASVSDMVFLENAVITQFAVVMRRHFTRRHSAVITPVFAVSTTYRVSVDTNTVATAI